MTAASQTTGFPGAVPGGTAQLAGRTVARIGFGVMQLERAAVDRDAALASVAGMYVLSSRTSRISAWYAVFFPVSGALIVYSMLRSMAVTLRDGGVTWRGTFYPLAELRKNSRRSAG